ncbi:Fusaric acid resistance protein family protein [compost metagenome]
MGATNASNIVGALNSGVALFVGTAAALCSMSLLQTLDSNRSRARLQDVIRRDIARRAAGQVRNASDWTSRMVDRLALLAPRLRGHPDAARTLRTMFADMRAASAVAELRVIGRTLKDRSSRECHALLMHRATAHFRTPTPRLVNAPLLESLERTRDAVSTGSAPGTEHVLALLSGLRRDLLAHED